MIWKMLILSLCNPGREGTLRGPFYKIPLAKLVVALALLLGRIIKLFMLCLHVFFFLSVNFSFVVFLQRKQNEDDRKPSLPLNSV